MNDKEKFMKEALKEAKKHIKKKKYLWERLLLKMER